MYNIDSALLAGGQIQKYYLTPLYRSTPFIGGQRCQPFQMGHSLYIRGSGGGGRSIDTILMSMVSDRGLCLCLYRQKRGKKTPSFIKQKIASSVRFFVLFIELGIGYVQVLIRMVCCNQCQSVNIF
jgi:hypothetical protein